MKKTIIFLFCGIMTMLVSGWTEARSEKFYITPEKLHIENQSMFVFTGAAWQQVSAIYSDAAGLFVERMPDSDTWYCRKCKEYHSYDKGCPLNK